MMTMYVEYYNHVPQARMLARGVDVRWGEEQGIVKVAEELAPARGQTRRSDRPAHWAALEGAGKPLSS